MGHLMYVGHLFGRKSRWSMLVDWKLKEDKKAINDARAPGGKLVEIWKTLFSAVSRNEFLLNITSGSKPEVMLLTGDVIGDFNRRYKVLVRMILADGRNQKVFVIDNLELTVSAPSSCVIGSTITVAGSTITVAGSAEYRLIEDRIEKLGSLMMNGLRKR